MMRRILKGGNKFVFLISSSTTRLYRARTGPKTERLTILRAATQETEWGDHDFCLSRSHYTDTDPTSRERARRPQGGNKKLISFSDKSSTEITVDSHCRMVNIISGKWQNGTSHLYLNAEWYIPFKNFTTHFGQRTYLNVTLLQYGTIQVIDLL